MKKFYIKFIPFLIIILLIGVGIPVYIDPYNIFHVNEIRDNGIEPNKNYIKTSYILQNEDKFDSFLFGSSRVGAIHTENIEGLNCYNMTYSMGLPKEHLENIKTFIANGIIPKTVIIGLDNMAHLANPQEHYAEPLRCPYPNTLNEKLDFYNMYLNTSLALESLETSNAYVSENEEWERTKLYEYGWWLDYNYESTYDWANATPSWGATFSDRTEDALAEVKEIVEVCEANNIELIIFTNPMPEITYNMAVENGYLDFLYQLAEVTDYYNFSGLNSVTVDIANFVDNSHYTAEIGDVMIDCMFNGNVAEELLAEGFGYQVTTENRDAFISLLNAQ